MSLIAKTNEISNGSVIIPIKDPATVEERICVICRNILNPGEALSPPCANGHEFHAECLRPWRRAQVQMVRNPVHAACPTCRDPLVLEPEEEVLANTTRQHVAQFETFEELEFEDVVFTPHELHLLQLIREHSGAPAAPPSSPREEALNMGFDNVPIGIMSAPLSVRYYTEAFRHINRQQQHQRNMQRTINTIALVLGALIVSLLFRII